jgi:serine/threonine protein kinase
VGRQGGVPLTEDMVWKWALHIIIGLNHMHTRKILHRDLKSANIFISNSGDAKIGDLGVSRMLATHQKMAHTIVGTPFYLSPELCEGKPYNEKSDVWALGVIMFEMCSDGSLPFQASNQGALIMKILSDACGTVPDRCKNLIKIRSLTLPLHFLLPPRLFISLSRAFALPCCAPANHFMHARRYSQELRKTVSACLTKEPRNRPDTYDMLADRHVMEKAR